MNESEPLIIMMILMPLIWLIFIMVIINIRIISGSDGVSTGIAYKKGIKKILS